MIDISISGEYRTREPEGDETRRQPAGRPKITVEREDDGANTMLIVQSEQVEDDDRVVHLTTEEALDLAAMLRHIANEQWERWR